MASVESPRSLPPEAWEPLLRVARLARRPLDRFLRIEAASGALLMLAAAVALGLANSPWREAYAAFVATPLGLRVGPFAAERDLAWVVNDGCMVVFFFVVGLEIRRELHHGELSELRRAALPFAAALGGMLAPAALYLGVAGEGASRSGWGVPMATDIAFAVGVLALLGRRVPPALRVLLLALAVIDDLGAILVIALFYSSGLAFAGFGIAMLGLLGVLLFQRLGVRSPWAYVPMGIVIWGGIYGAGVHPTIAGVLLGFATPVRTWTGVETRAPSEQLIEALHPYVAFGIMPLFAFVNAGVTIEPNAFAGAGRTVVLGVLVGLVIGKPLGVLLACEALRRLGIVALPFGIGLRHLVVLGVVAGVGFTMSLFVAQLAFADPSTLAAAKLGVLIASAVAALAAVALGRAILPERVDASAATSADEAESSTER